jgi:hypothetical protein
MRHLLLAALAFILITACNKEPGEGGQAVIRGKVWVENWNQSFTSLNAAYDGVDENVYLIYDGNVTYDQRVITGPDGAFQFTHLLPGSYTVYVYSEDPDLQAPSGIIAIMDTVVISDKTEIIDMAMIKIYD